MTMQTISKISKEAFFLCLLLAPSLILAQGSWSTASSDGFTNRRHAASSAIEGKIYVLAGDNYGLINSLEVYDPLTDSWSTPTTTGTFTARASLSSAVVGNKIYAIGGVTGSLSSSITVNLVEVFDPSTNEWITLTTTGIFTPRRSFTSAVINDKIYVIGGRNQNGGFVSSLEMFDPATNEWSTPEVTGNFTARSGLACSVFDGKIYTFFGVNSTEVLNTVEVFDPLTNSWSTPMTTGICTARRGLVSNVLEGKIYVIGGYSGLQYPNGNYLNTVEVYEPLTNTWSTPTTSGNFTARYVPTSAVVGSKIYVIGGESATSILNTNEVFTPLTSEITAENNSSEFGFSPNPASDFTTINYTLAEHGTVLFTITNSLGIETAKISDNQIQEAGNHSLNYAAGNLTPGVYFLTIKSGNSSETKKMIVIR